MTSATTEEKDSNSRKRPAGTTVDNDDDDAAADASEEDAAAEDDDDDDDDHDNDKNDDGDSANHNHNNYNNQNEWREITLAGDLPQKKFYRQRAHANPLSHNDSFHYPVAPAAVNWRDYYHYADSVVDAAAVAAGPPTVLDIGCGFGGLTMRLCRLLPHERILGLEIRTKVTEYVRLRILHARRQHQQEQPQLPDETKRDNTVEEKEPAFAFNAAVLRTNSMKYFPNYFARGSLHKIFICFPDPHFKRKNYPRRIVSTRLLSEYAYGLQFSGRLYLITDVSELHQWHVAHCDAHPLFRRLFVSSNTTTTEEIILIDHDDDDKDKDTTHTNRNKNTNTTTTNVIKEEDDPCIEAMRTVTEEGQKVARNQGDKYYAVYERIADNDENNTKFTAARLFSL
jgi:tRNA (guanine-N7-)-methyltransferase